MTSLSPRARLAAWIGAGVLGGGLLTGFALSQFGVATAASSSPSPYASERPRPALPGLPPLMRLRDRLEGGGPFGDAGPGLGFLGRVLHGEATVQTPKGTTQVVVTQSGNITDVTDSTITVKSSDGYTASYTIDKNTRISLNGTDGALSSLKKGDTVRVVGTKSGSTTHAGSVVDGMPPMGFGTDPSST